MGRDVLSAIPDRAGIVEDLEVSIAVLNRTIHDSAAAQRVELILIPTPKNRTIAQHVALEQWGASYDHSSGEGHEHSAATVGDAVAGVPTVASVGVIPPQEFGGHAQTIT